MPAIARGWRKYAYRRAVVHLRTGRTLVGLIDTRGPLIVLRNAEVVEGANRLKVDGEAIVERTQVEWVQMLPTGEA